MKNPPIPPTPAKPLKGKGNDRREITQDAYETNLKKYPAHFAIILHREAINRFGKLGFVPHYYASPEIALALKLNIK